MEFSSEDFIENTPVLPPEVEEGNIEYKWKLIDPGPSRFEHLVTQMKWRLNEGSGQALYRLGVEDDGNMVGLEARELSMSLATLHRMASRLKASVEVLQDHHIRTNASLGSERLAVDLIIRQSPSQNYGLPTIGIAVLGGVDAGKSTLIGVLTEGQLDNGRGRARVNLFRHLHEVQTGRTSCLSNAQLGFNTEGKVTNYAVTGSQLTRIASLDELARSSAHLITLFDLAGHTKYQRTSLAGLCRGQPLAVLLVVPASTGLNDVGFEHLQLAMALQLPLVLVITKVDQLADAAIDPDELYRRLIGERLAGLSRMKEYTLLTGNSQFSRCNSPNAVLCSPPPFPIFTVSCVTGQGISELTSFLGQLASICQASVVIRRSSLQTLASIANINSPLGCPALTSFLNHVKLRLDSVTARSNSPGMCFWITDVFNKVVGLSDPVLVGYVRYGQLHCGSLVWVGPDKFGDFHLVQVTSIMLRRQSHDVILPGQTASIVVRLIESSPSSPTDAHASPKHRSASAQDKSPSLLNNVPGSRLSFHAATSSTPTPAASATLSNSRKRAASTSDHYLWFADESSNTNSDEARHPRLALWRGMVLLDSLKSPSPISTPDGAPSAGVTWSVEIGLQHRLLINPPFLTHPNEALTSRPDDDDVALYPLPKLGQRVTVYAGCVVQGASVISVAECHSSSTVQSSHINNTNLPEAFIRLNFKDYPEYMELNRPVILSWADTTGLASPKRGTTRNAKCVGYISRLGDLININNRSQQQQQHPSAIQQHPSRLPTHPEVLSPVSPSASSSATPVQFTVCDSSSTGDSPCSTPAMSDTGGGGGSDRQQELEESGPSRPLSPECCAGVPEGETIQASATLSVRGTRKKVNRRKFRRVKR